MRTNSRQIVRNPGLDLLRAIAIIFVLVYHLPIGDHVQGLGLFGVEIFLTLSGYLVAAMIFERFGGIATTAQLRSFLVNRWIRTLPLYYLTLLATVAVTTSLATTPLPDVSVFLVFLQNVTQGGLVLHGNWFGGSWSLALEEWFYLLLPVTLFLSRGRPPARVIVLLTIVLAAVSVGGRAVRYMGETTFDFDDMYRRVVVFRLDTFCWGMLVYLAISRWEGAVVRFRNALFAAGGIVVTLSVAIAANPVYGQAFLAIGLLTTLSIGTALAIPFFRSLDITGPARDVLAFLSTRTYALYLTHGIVYALVSRCFAGATPIVMALMLIASVIVADLVYRHIERPILALRTTDDANPLENLSTAIARLRARIAFEMDLMTGFDPTPVYAPALNDRRRMPRY